MTTFATIEIITRIAVAIGLGTAMGLERTLAGKTAGMRTHAMISLGSAVFVLVSQTLMLSLSNPLIASPVVMPAAIITGIGFIGAGFIMLHANKVTGLTTAAGLWVAAGVGMASGFGFLNLAIISTISAILIFTIMWFIEQSIRKYSYDPQTEEVNAEVEKIRRQQDKFFSPSDV